VAVGCKGVFMEINVRVIEVGDNYIKLLLENIPLHLANAIRRAALAEVPSMAIDEVMFIDNTSALYDEVLAHRLALIPLTSDAALSKYKPPEECIKCSTPEECEGCYVTLFMDISAKEGNVTVYSRDLISRDPDVRPVSGDIPIVVLAPGQRVALEARARLGRGREHIKWSPTTVATVTYLARISVDKGKCTLCGKCVEVCPRKVFEVVKNELMVHEDRCMLCRQCIKVCDYDAINLGWYEDKYVLHIEGTGALRPERIFVESIKVLVNKLQKILEEISILEGGREV